MHRKPIRLLFVFFTLLLATSTLAEFPVPNDTLNFPRSYGARFTDEPLKFDGLPTEAMWDSVMWSDPFVDIRGLFFQPQPRYHTAFKMLWDNDYLYIYAWMDEPHLWATYDQHDMVIYHENDFEVFIDPDGDNHNYYELEINALGTTWDLLLTRPYRDNGMAVDSWEIPGLKSAVHLQGTLNDPSDTDDGWGVELAFPWTVLEECTHRQCPPKVNDYWWINFSRVQWQLDIVDGRYQKKIDPSTGQAYSEDNWVWSPQGLIAMHYPEQWGRVRFVSEPVELTADIDLLLDLPWTVHMELRRELMHVYYKQRLFRDENNRWATNCQELEADTLFHHGMYKYPIQLEVSGSETGFQARYVLHGDFTAYLTVDQTGRLWWTSEDNE